jgi:diaminohydroxyphosphoribosylaminopyrimidine deaminase/5-amino-6-(5-phosphoribosylamino)uracil reductase
MHTDQHFMGRALKLAANTAALASPNPQGGCVLVRKNLVIGEGAHLYDGRDHAEIVALKHAASRGVSTRGATAYVTLEPCSHHGRTPPCADALIAAGVTRAVVATTDPNPLVSGQGIAKLKNAGIEVTLGICQGQARDLNDAFAHFIQTRRPFVTLKAALSADGKLAPPPAERLTRQPHWLTGPAARYEVQLLRHASDAILTGIGTILADNPALTDRSNILGPGDLPRRRPLLRVILDTHLRIPPNSQLLQVIDNASGPVSDLLIFCGPAALTSRIAELEDLGAEVHILPQHAGRLSLAAVLDHLAERQCISLLLECGSELNGAFLAQHFVDKAVLFYAQQNLGPQAIPFARDFGPPELLEAQLTRTQRSTIGPDTIVTGYLHDPWQTQN